MTKHLRRLLRKGFAVSFSMNDGCYVIHVTRGRFTMQHVIEADSCDRALYDTFAIDFARVCRAVEYHLHFHGDAPAKPGS